MRNVKIGDTVYILMGLFNKVIVELTVKEISTDNKGKKMVYIRNKSWGMLTPFDENVFLSRKDAEQALMKENELKLCPFCGNEAIAYGIEPHKHFLIKMPDYNGGGFVKCSSCGAGISADTVQKAIEKWNGRAKNE